MNTEILTKLRDSLQGIVNAMRDLRTAAWSTDRRTHLLQREHSDGCLCFNCAMRFSAKKMIEAEEVIALAEQQGKEQGPLVLDSSVVISHPPTYLSREMSVEMLCKVFGEWMVQSLGAHATEREWKALEKSLSALVAPPAKEWISVEERLPRRDLMVLVRGGIAELREGDVWYSLTGLEYPGRPISWQVTHWMPMPVLPSSPTT